MKHFKKLWIFASLVLAISFANTAYATDNALHLVYNGKFIKADIPPKLIEGRMLVPIRLLSELKNLTISWDGHTKTVTISDKSTGHVLKLTADQKTVYKDNQAIH
jgi:hypothetical protein